MPVDEETKEKTTYLALAFVQAMAEAIRQAGSQKNMAEATGIHQSRLSDYVNGNYDFANLTVGSLIRMFPELNVSYFDHPGAQAENNAQKAMERRMLAIFRRLDVDSQILCFEMMAKTFGENFKEIKKG